MKRILVLGAGKIGVTVAHLLNGVGNYNVTLGDMRDRPGAARDGNAIEHIRIDAGSPADLRRHLARCEAVISTLPFFLCQAVAQAARAADVHYFDPTEDVQTARRIRDIASGAQTVFAPQCGLAPGFIAIVAQHLVDRFDEPHDVRLRVGALPQFPDNMLRYNLTWSTDGLINEYCNLCEVIHDGRRGEAQPLEGFEQFSLDGGQYEAFATSGGVGSLCETLAGRVRNLNYKTIRYPGHRDMIRMLVNDLGLCGRRDVFRDVIEHGIPVTRQDVVVIFASVTGRKDGRLVQESYARRIYAQSGGEGWSAIQLTTASAICAVVDLVLAGALPSSGFLKQEQIGYDAFIGNRFGRVYA